MDHISRVLWLTGGKITVFTGRETMVLPSLVLGANGSICTIGNLIPREMVEIYNLFRAGKIEEAGRKQLSIMGLFNILVSSVEMQVVKDGLKILGHGVGDCLMPVDKIPADVKEKLKVELKKMGKL
jgi:4-hydroxy-tetrahydrodipicolinate synthase